MDRLAAAARPGQGAQTLAATPGSVKQKASVVTLTLFDVRAAQASGVPLGETMHATGRDAELLERSLREVSGDGRYRLQRIAMPLLAWLGHPTGGGEGLVWSLFAVGVLALLLGHARPLVGQDEHEVLGRHVADVGAALVQLEQEIGFARHVDAIEAALSSAARLAWTVLIAGHAMSGHRCLSRSRILGAPQLG